MRHGGGELACGLFLLLSEDIPHLPFENRLDHLRFLRKGGLPDGLTPLLFLDALGLGLQFFCYLFEFEVHILAYYLTSALFTLTKSSVMLGKCFLMKSELCLVVWKFGPVIPPTSISSRRW